MKISNILKLSTFTEPIITEKKIILEAIITEKKIILEALYEDARLFEFYGYSYINIVILDWNRCRG